MDGKRLRIRRRDKGLTQTQIAEIVGTTKGSISNYETGFSTPSHDILCRLADILDTSTDYLLGRDIDICANTISKEQKYVLSALENMSKEKRDTIIRIIGFIQDKETSE
ncbi:helix-turn-helix domain-containing protein [Bacillus spizizenii]|nr:helix-turn-helix domain-containing protein [Bacillus spizizenii]MCY9124914.1 helix-turn-helix domain-containing protein [Bacillus spizizenii]